MVSCCGGVRVLVAESLRLKLYRFPHAFLSHSISYMKPNPHRSDHMTIPEVTVQRATQESSSSQGSTQTTQDAHSLLVSTDRNIWGSLIPCNPSNKHIRRIDFSKDQAKYVIGRSRKLKGDVDVSFRHLASLSELRVRSKYRISPYLRAIFHFCEGSRHCEIIWDGVESSRSAVIVKDLGSRNGTYVRCVPLTTLSWVTHAL